MHPARRQQFLGLVVCPWKGVAAAYASAEAKCQTVYKPGFVQGVAPSVRPFIWDPVRTGPLATYPDTPTHKRAVTSKACHMVSLFGLAPGGACHASFLTVGAVGSYPTVSPLPVESKDLTGGLFSVALSLRPCPKAAPRRALPATMFAWSPDFPPLRLFKPCKSGRPTV